MKVIIVLLLILSAIALYWRSLYLYVYVSDNNNAVKDISLLETITATVCSAFIANLTNYWYYALLAIVILVSYILYVFYRKAKKRDDDEKMDVVKSWLIYFFIMPVIVEILFILGM